MLNIMIAENAGQEAARPAVLIEAVGAIVMKIVFERMITVGNAANAEIGKYNSGQLPAEGSIRAASNNQIPQRHIREAVDTIKASDLHLRLMLKVQVRINAAHPAGSEPRNQIPCCVRRVHEPD